MTDVVIQQNSRKVLMMDILMSETCWAHKKWNKIASDINLVFYSSTRYELFINLLTPNVNYGGRTASLTSKVAFYIFIQQI